MAERIFPRQELTDQQRSQARRDGVKLTEGKGVVQLRGICIALCEENMRLMLELKTARAALGLEPLTTYEVK
jgi:hypothetical protein